MSFVRLRLRRKWFFVPKRSPYPAVEHCLWTPPPYGSWNKGHGTTDKFCGVGGHVAKKSCRPKPVPSRPRNWNLAFFPMKPELSSRSYRVVVVLAVPGRRLTHPNNPTVSAIPNTLRTRPDGVAVWRAFRREDDDNKLANREVYRLFIFFIDRFLFCSLSPRKGLIC